MKLKCVVEWKKCKTIVCSVFSVWLHSVDLFVCFFFQLSVIDPIRREITEARNAINMGDYPRAIELLGRAIEVLTC